MGHFREKVNDKIWLLHVQLEDGLRSHLLNKKLSSRTFNSARDIVIEEDESFSLYEQVYDVLYFELEDIPVI